jgi:AcrR family transcriptional regulator
MRDSRRDHDDAAVVVPEGMAPPGLVPAPVFTAAADAFVSGQRLDMRSLARRLGLSRATLYRRTGNRERLLDEVLWWRARRLLVDQVTAAAGLAGAAKIAAVIGGVLGAVERDGPLRAFLESEPEAALRILTGGRSVVQQGMAGALENLIELERGRGTFATELDTPALAYAIVRISEGFLYADVIADREPDIRRAVTLIEGLLLGLDMTRRQPDGRAVPPEAPSEARGRAAALARVPRQ